jgi:outer membrane protein assembly factor BamB
MEDSAIKFEKSKFGRRTLGWTALSFLAIAIVAYLLLVRLDRASANLTSGACAMVGLFIGWLWLISRLSSRSMAFWLIATIPVVAMASLAGLFEFRGFSGEMVPQFRLRNAARLAPQATPSSVETASDPKYSNPNESFRQFLGNERNGMIRGTAFSVDWDSKPPKIIWKKPVGLGWSGFAVQDGLAITMEEFENQDALVAMNLSDGTIRWRTLLGRKHYHPAGGGGPRATPTIDRDLVFSQSSTGIVTCCKLDSGKLIWKADLLEFSGISQPESEAAVSWGRSGSPLVDEHQVIVPMGGGSQRSSGGLVSLDRATGAEKWRGGRDQISYSSPSLFIIQGVPQIVIVNESTVTGQDPMSGDVWWSFDWPGESNGGASVSQPVLVDDTSLFLSKAYGRGSAMLDFSKSSPPTWNPEVKWKDHTLLKTKFTSAIHHDGYLYGLSDGILECVRASDGKRMWKDSRSGRFGHGQILMLNDQLLASCEDGRLVFGTVDPNGFHKIGEVQVLEGITWNTFAIAGDRVLLRNGEVAACVKLSLEP